jgi:hypothetical protein
MASDYITKLVSDSLHTGEESAPSDETPSDETPDTPHVLSQPSAYLRSRCPLCFGGKDWRQHRDPGTK